MAKKKTLSSGRRRRRATSTPKRRTRRRRTMSAGLNMAGFKGAALNTGKGLLGGAIYVFAAKTVDPTSSNPNKRIATALILSFVASMFGKQPIIGAGIAGAGVVGQAYRIPGLNDGEYETVEFIRPNTLLDQFPLATSNFVDEHGQQLYPLSDGTFTNIYPGWLNPGMYDGMGARSLVNRSRGFDRGAR